MICNNALMRLSAVLIALVMLSSVGLADGPEWMRRGYDVYKTKALDVSEQCAPLHTFTGEAADDGFGWSVEGAGDVDGDGYDDLIVGAPRSDAAGPQSGRAYIYSGQTGSLLYVFTGESAGDHFGGGGQSLGGTSDINGDGYLDFIFGARFNDAAGWNTGRVYIFLGGPGPFPIALAASDADMIVSGDAPGDRLGYSVSIAGDMNDDGYGDLIMGATQDYGGGSTIGRAYVFFGSPGPYPVNASASDADIIMLGDNVGDRFGLSVSGVGDVNDDGFGDVIVGAPGNDQPNISGRVYMFLGGSGPYPTIIQASSADLICTGEAEADFFGVSVSDAGDMNKDGFDDFSVGAPYCDAGGTDAGRMYVFFGSPGPFPSMIGAAAAEIIITGESPYDWFGCAVSNAGDVNCDSYLDLLIGASPWEYASPNDAGRAYLFLGESRPYPINIDAADADMIFFGEAAGDLFGTVVSGAGDVTGDGSDDLIIGAPKNDVGGADAGRAYVYDCFECEPVVQYVKADIKPGSCPNPLNIGKGDSDFWVYVDDDLDIGSSHASSDAFAKAHPNKRRGVLPVAVLGTDDFDVSEIDITSVMLEGVPVLRHNYEDVSTPVPDDADECECTDIGPDGFIDLTLKFDKNAVVAAIGEVEVGDVIPLTLTGELLDGTSISGVDCVVIVGHDGPKFSQSGESLFELINYPNPFNPTTEISFNLPVMSNVRLDVYNVMGQKVTTLVDGPMQPGPHSVTWNGMSDSGESVSSGIYFYRLEAGNYSESRKMLLLK